MYFSLTNIQSLRRGVSTGRGVRVTRVCRASKQLGSTLLPLRPLFPTMLATGVLGCACSAILSNKEVACVCVRVCYGPAGLFCRAPGCYGSIVRYT